ncbi:hypothetical protein BJ170DRAFT_441606 [Xylariales sp. AK1849]|nr:hypothetical protein BJ170DRAFT_441606 [Xylariales sp. AK1849]
MVHAYYVHLQRFCPAFCHPLLNMAGSISMLRFRHRPSLTLRNSETPYRLSLPFPIFNHLPPSLDNVAKRSNQIERKGPGIVFKARANPRDIVASPSRTTRYYKKTRRIRQIAKCASATLFIALVVSNGATNVANAIDMYRHARGVLGIPRVMANDRMCISRKEMAAKSGW